MLPVRIRPEAEQDLDESYRFYERALAGLGDRFMAAVGETIQQIRATPERFPTTYRDLRQSLVPRFPFTVCYLSSELGVEVVAIFHASRAPGELEDRT
jgi:toxin ParE1/3/4